MPRKGLSFDPAHKALTVKQFLAQKPTL